MANPDLEELLNVLFPFAQDMLAKYGEFFPFAASMDKKGKVACVGGHTGDEQPPSEEVLEILEQGLSESAKKGQIRAAGICLDMRIQPSPQEPKTDAICARLEHENGEALEIYMPYKKKMLKGYKYGDLIATEGERKIFTKS
jgi:hypothetical protein